MPDRELNDPIIDWRATRGLGVEQNLRRRVAAVVRRWAIDKIDTPAPLRGLHEQVIKGSPTGIQYAKEQPLPRLGAGKRHLLECL